MHIERLTPDWSAAYEWDDMVLTRKLFQPGRRRELERAALLKREGVVEDRETFGRWCLSIPLEDYEYLTRWSIKWRDLGAPCNATREKAYRRFLASPDSRPYRVRDRAS